MNNLVTTLEKIIPSELQVLYRRYDILRNIDHYQTVGRRVLSEKLSISERILRKDIELLKDCGLISVSPMGMSITQNGLGVLEELDPTMHKIYELPDLERTLQKVFRGVAIKIVPGDLDEDLGVKASLGRYASKIFEKQLSDNSIIAVTGGTTVATMVEQFKTGKKILKETLVVPARGSLGNSVEYQANTLAATLAAKIGASHKLLNIPDNLSEEVLKSLKKDPEIKKIISLIYNPNLLIIGIGDALKMAKRRNLSNELIEMLKDKGAVAETCGYYFNQNGDIVYNSPTVGIKIDLLEKVPTTISLAGGKSKASAIYAIRHYLQHGYLIIDEGAAREIVKKYNLK